ncbi:MAG: T9SS type A sorting domain-containing protein [Flavobacteriales bacterium]|nr:T9SS type A sorting domain-containing protein [Flavobacteriales bacterium]
MNAYDLEITQDGGFAFVGNYRHAETGNFFNWVVKTDACGEEIFNGCQAVIGVVEEKTSNTGLSLYPNPANALLMIDYKPAGIYSINIYDTMGKLVLQQNTDPFATQFLVDLSELSTSIYEVRLSEVDDTFRTSAIFIKE